MATFTRISLVSIISGSADPAQILKLANRAVHTRTEGTEYVTATCVAYHPDGPAVGWTSAGHPLPIAMPHAEELQPIRYATPLGLNAELDVTGQHAPLAPPMPSCSTPMDSMKLMALMAGSVLTESWPPSRPRLPPRPPRSSPPCAARCESLPTNH
jgi:hypothetical protein